MPGAVVAVLICVWYYQTASKLNINPLPWIVGAVVIYYAVKYGWTYGIARPVFGPRVLSPMLNDLSGAALGLIATAVFRSRVLLKQKPLE